MEIYSVLITGANRGIGLEFTRQLVGSRRPPKHVFATYRNEDSTQKLKEIQNSASSDTKVHLLKLDVRNTSDIEQVRRNIEETVGDNGLTLLINNAGVMQWLGYPNVTTENLTYHFDINVVGPVLIAQAMLPLLKKAVSRKPNQGMSFSKAGILSMTSDLGSIANVGILFPMDVGAPAYKISKTALNMGMRVLSCIVKDDGILVVNMSPGWVKTDLGSDHAELLPQDSIAAMLETIPTLNEAQHGGFVNRFGKEIEW